MATKETRINREGGKWTVYVRNGAERATQAAWLCLGGCGDAKVAFRLWLALLGDKGRK